jgi:predicted dinucleotide-binding enzyme
MNVGILGSGIVARTLGSGFVRHGQTIMLGTRDPKKLAEWGAANGAKVGSVADAAEFGELLVLAVKGGAALDVLQSAGDVALAGKVVLDTTNPIAAAPPVNGVLKYFTSLDESLMEKLQAAHPATRFVKAFNSVGNAKMVNPAYAGGRPTMFICGNDDAARDVVAGVCDMFGWEVLDLGKAEAARAIEPLCILWCIPGFLRNAWSLALKVVHA